MTKYYNPNLQDSVVDLGSASSLDMLNPNDAGTKQRLLSSGYQELMDGQNPSYRTPQYNQNGIPFNPGSTMTKDQFISDRYPTVDENAIRTQMLNEQQQRIDAINSVYKSLYQEQNKTAQDRLGQTRAMAARSGLTGSTMGAAQQGQTQAANLQELEALKAKQALAISEVYNDINYAARQEIDKQMAQATKSADEYQAYLQNAIATSRDKLNNAIVAGQSWDDIKAQAGDQLSSYIKNLGFDNEYDAANYVTAYKNANTTTQKPLEVNKGSVLIDPSTGKVIYQPNADTAPSAEYKFIAATRYQPAGYFNPATGDFKPVSGSSPSISTGANILSTKSTPTVKVPTTTKEKASAATEMIQALNTVKGGDGYVSPDDYLKARNAWIENGLSPTDFDTKFKGFMNPNNPNYATVKKTATQIKAEEPAPVENKSWWNKALDWLNF